MHSVSGIICGYVTLCVLTIFSLTRPAVGSVNNNLHGIGHVSITTDDLVSSTSFYTEILGGMVITDLSYRYHGDQHYYIMFDKEITEAREKGVDPSELGVPDISNTGTYEVRGKFIVFDNGIVQLQSFVRRDVRYTNVHFEAREYRTSLGYVSAGYVGFSVSKDVDFHNYLAGLERLSKSKGFTQVKVNPIVNVDTEEERLNLPENQFGPTMSAGGYAGVSFGHVQGPSGEQVEFLQLTGDSRNNFGKEYCKRQSVSSQFLDSYNDNVYKQRAGITGRPLRGLIQFGTRCEDLQLTTKFYTEILGGTLLGPPLFGENIRSDEFYASIFHKELLDARRLGVTPESLGIPDITAGGPIRFDIRFILFDNFPIEAMHYTNGASLNDPPFNPRYEWSSPAYINSISIAFQLHENVDFDYYLRDIESRAQSEGYSNVRLNRCSDSMCTSPAFPAGSSLEGYRYAYMKGPSGEQMIFTQFRGRAARVLKQAFLKYGALSTAFDETNPWKRDEFHPFCSQYDIVKTDVRCAFNQSRRQVLKSVRSYPKAKPNWRSWGPPQGMFRNLNALRWPIGRFRR